MTNAKQTLQELGEAKIDMKKKLEPLFELKNTKREALRTAFEGKPDKIKTEIKLIRGEENEKRRKENAILIEKYKKLNDQKELDEKTFQKALEEFRKLNSDVDVFALRKAIFGEEEKEIVSKLPSTVAKQERDALKYFRDNKDLPHLKVVEGIQKLRAKGEIIYIDLGGGKYRVTMPCGGRKVTMEFPPDTSKADSKTDYTNFADETITNKEITKGKLWSKEGEKYLEEQKKSHKGLITKAEFLELGKSLCPAGNEEEQILAFMLATGFYGWMRLSDTDAKKKDFQLAVKCSRESAYRGFYKMGSGHDECSLVHSTFIG